uniref:ATP-dependent RNA helicase n=1 Tax=Panagrolaimus sp. PS1159 TaxID=55785 RepID=A0AC35GBS5_9BILA
MATSRTGARTELNEFNDFNDFGRVKTKKNIYRNYKFNKKAVINVKGKLPGDNQIRESNRGAVETNPDFFNPEDDVCVEGVGAPLLAPEYFKEDSTLDITVRQNLAKLGYQQLTHVQRIVIPLISRNNDHDVIVCGRTGSGKTLGYIIAAVNNAINDHKRLAVRDTCVQRNPSILILVQVNSAAMHVYNLARKLALSSSIVIGSAIGDNNRTDEFANYEKDGADILVATAGRLSDYLTSMPAMLNGVKLLVLDDAETFMRDDDWIEAITIIKEEAIGDRKCQTVCLSAGFDERSFKSFFQFCDNDHWFIDIASLGKVEKSIPQTVIDTARKNRTEETMRIMLERSVDNRYPKTIIFCNAKEIATMLSHRLRLDRTLPSTFRPRVAFLHGGTFDAASVFDAFCTEKGKRTDLTGNDSVEIDVIVTCDGYAYGIDAKVELVINFDFPTSLCVYAQRIGRVGRHGAKGGIAYTLVDSESLRVLPKRCEDNIINVLTAASDAKAKLPDSLAILLD